jgi:hypothetical protein
LTAATTFAADVELIFINGGDVDEAGERHNWTYYFKSPGLNRVLAWQYEHDDESVTRLTSVRPDFPIILHPGMPAIPDSWIDSGVAIQTADAHGGADFRAGHSPDRYHVELILLPANDDGTNLLYKEPVWLALYSGDHGVFQAPIHALTGEHLEYPPATVQARFDDVAALAMAKADDVEFIFTRAFGVQPDGTAQRWTYVFRSLSRSRLYTFAVDGGRFGLSNEPPPGEANLNRAVIQENWIDSDVALEEAERLGGEAFRSSHSDWEINVSLHTTDFGLTEWSIYYTSNSGGESFDIDAIPQQPTMARQILSSALVRAQTVESDAELVYIAGPSVDLEGMGNDWILFFKSMSASRLFELRARSGRVLDVVNPINVDATFNLELPPLPGEFLDTDSAVAISERMGGSSFRSTHSDTNIDVTLLWLERGYTGVIGVGPRPIYLMTYWSPTGDQVFAFDAQAGAYEEWEHSSAREHYGAVANSIAERALPSDIQLTRINALGIEPEGTSNHWKYFYRSVSADRRYRIWVLGDHVYVPDGREGIDPGRQPLPDEWIDSRLAMSVIEEMGGRTFRRDNPGTEIGLELSVTDEGTYWEAMYGTDSAFELFRVDATDQTVGSERMDWPNAGTLVQVYPNPFAGFVWVEFQLEEAGNVSVEVYDVLGRRCLKASRGLMPAGRHKMELATSWLTPGTYLIVVNDRYQTRRTAVRAGR